jgi:serine/threonine protein phosphatase PrpC
VGARHVHRDAHAMAVVADGALQAAGLSDVGRRREVNEDRFHIDVGRGVFMVVDGVGGQAAGGRAADIAIRMLRERLERQTGVVADRVREAITIANNEIFHTALQRPEWHGMACVLTVVVVEGGHLCVGHVGDTRLYLLHDGQARKLTADHSPVGEREDARELSELEAMRHPRRHEVFRDVGSSLHHLADRDFIDVAEFALPSDAALLLCSDGLTDLVPIAGIQGAIQARRGEPSAVASALIDAANEAGGTDNVTVVYVEGPRFATASAPGPNRTARPVEGPVTSAAWRAWTAVLVVVLAAAAGWWAGRQGLGDTASVASAIAPPSAGAIVVRPDESIMAAIALAQQGSTVVVEPGEYRERLTLRDHVRVISRVPRAASILPPVGAGALDAAVVVVGVVGAELAGFRIIGAAASPLGVGVISRDASVRLVDLEVTGATAAALDLGVGDDVGLVGSDIHDNAGAAVVAGAGATPRFAHNRFASNGSAAGAVSPFVIDATARPVFIRNTFDGLVASLFPGVEVSTRQSLQADNWFANVQPQRPVTRPLSPAGGR